MTEQQIEEIIEKQVAEVRRHWSKFLDKGGEASDAELVDIRIGAIDFKAIRVQFWEHEIPAIQAILSKYCAAGYYVVFGSFGEVFIDASRLGEVVSVLTGSGIYYTLHQSKGVIEAILKAWSEYENGSE